MERLLNAVAAIAQQVSPEKVRAVASRVRQTTPDAAAAALLGVVATPAVSAVIGELIDAWRTANVSAAELASMLLASSYVVEQAESAQTVELVWTGPTTPFVSARRTEQALLQVINAATQTLFITSFVAYSVSAIVKALNAAIARGVDVAMLLELSHAHGGSVSIDGLGKMRTDVPRMNLFAWVSQAAEFQDGRVHAKVAVADGRMCFITSANLTGYAMERNMEAGILIVGGDLPRVMSRHLCSLVETKVVSRV